MNVLSVDSQVFDPTSVHNTCQIIQADNTHHLIDLGLSMYRILWYMMNLLSLSGSEDNSELELTAG